VKAKRQVTAADAVVELESFETDASVAALRVDTPHSVHGTRGVQLAFIHV